MRHMLPLITGLSLDFFRFRSLEQPSYHTPIQKFKEDFPALNHKTGCTGVFVSTLYGLHLDCEPICRLTLPVYFLKILEYNERRTHLKVNCDRK